jgi:EAL domain-containing protein (putative c-di-GMP-specific phosphodiesterase class I)
MPIQNADAELTRWADPLAQLRAAIDGDQFTLLCQPIRALIGQGGYPLAEILVRLREEETALLPPGDFLPILEHYRMMPLLDRWVVRHTLKACADSKIPKFSINVSRQSMADAAFPPFVAETFKRSEINPTSILFEIDEADILGDEKSSAQFAAAIKAIGCGVMIDGFGRKAVSFAPLKVVRADFLKIDGSLTRRLLTNEFVQTKVKAMVKVSNTLGIGVVAECVEQQDILARVKALGMGYAQGFGIVQPQPIEHLAAVAR